MSWEGKKIRINTWRNKWRKTVNTDSFIEGTGSTEPRWDFGIKTRSPHIHLMSSCPLVDNTTECVSSSYQIFPHPAAPAVFASLNPPLSIRLLNERCIQFSWLNISLADGLFVLTKPDHSRYWHCQSPETDFSLQITVAPNPSEL